MPRPRPRRLSHIGPSGAAHMVDVSHKPSTDRLAIAEGFVRVSPALARAIRADSLAKGNLLDTARLAGVTGAKRTAELVPLCHTVPLDHVDVTATLERATDGRAGPGHRVRLRAAVRCLGRTGVEMEALTAVAIAALTVIDMGKAIDKAMVIEGVRLIEKRGGRSGTYRASPP